MKRRRRTEILVNGAKELAAQLAEEITRRYDVKTIEAPNHGLVMIKARETSKKSLFYIGEVFVTECKVQIHDAIGLGILKSDDRQHAYHLAVIDAAYQADLPETTGWTDRLLAAEAAWLDRRLAAQRGVLQTKVNFETMDEEGSR